MEVDQTRLRCVNIKRIYVRSYECVIVVSAFQISCMTDRIALCVEQKLYGMGLILFLF